MSSPNTNDEDKPSIATTTNDTSTSIHQAAAATKIQKVWRGIRVRIIDKPQRISETTLQRENTRSHEASLTIQSFFKILSARRHLAELKRVRAAEELRKKQEKACLLIQSILRYQKSRKEEFSARRFVPLASTCQLKIATRVRGFLCRIKHGNIHKAFERYNGHRRLHSAATVIQALVRGVLTRNRFESWGGIGCLLVESRVEEGAVIFQRIGRGYLDRQHVFWMSVGEQTTTTTTATTAKDETHVKNNKDRRRSDFESEDDGSNNQNYNNMNVPSVSSLTATTKSMTTLKEDDVTEIDNTNNEEEPDRGYRRSSAFLPPAALSSSLPPNVSPSPTANRGTNNNNSANSPFSIARMLRSITVCQSVARRFLHRNTIFNLKMNKIHTSSIQLRTGCVIMIQKFWRGHLQRQRYDNQLKRYRAAMVLHGAVLGYLARAFDLASMHHFKLHRERAELEHKSATKIASVVKMFFAKKYVWGMNKLVLRIQRVCRANKDRLYVRTLLRERSAARIQRQTRKFLQLKKRKMRYELLRETLAAEQERNLAAIIIQAMIRMCLNRMAYVREVTLSRVEKIRMKRIGQRMWQNYDERKRFREARENFLAKKVQRRWLSYTTQIRENFEILRLEFKLEGINVKAMNNLENAHRTVVEEEYFNWFDQTFEKIRHFNHKTRQLLDRLHHWHTEGQFIPSQMLRLYEVQRLARGAAARQKYQRGLLMTQMMTADASLMNSPRHHLDAADSTSTSTDQNTSSSNMMKLTSGTRSLLQASSARRRVSVHLLSAKENPGKEKSAELREQHSILDVLNLNSSAPTKNDEGNTIHNNTPKRTGNNNNNNTDDSSTSIFLDSLSPILRRAGREGDISTSITTPSAYREENLTNTTLPIYNHQQYQTLEKREFVDLSHTYLNLAVMKKYFVTLRFSTIIRSMDASHCSLGDDTASYLIEVCTGMPNLHSLNISHNPITDAAATKILSWLESSEADKVRHVDVRRTLISKRYQQCIGEMLKKEDHSDLDMLRRRVMAIELPDEDV